MKTAVVIGSTGLIGSLLIKKLVQQGTFSQIIAICRHKPKNDPTFESPKIRTLQFDFQGWNNLDLQVSSFVGTSACSFFCCLGTTISQAGSEEAFKKVDYEYVVNFAKLAKHCRAQQLFVISALGADKDSSVLYNRTKGEMEAAVQVEYSGDLHFLRPSLLLGDRKDFRFAERVAILMAPVYSGLLIGSLKKYQPIKAEQVVKALTELSAKKITAPLFIENSDLLKI
jgi:uncharacterized protein YbjT (DUF2867 family)